MDLSKWFWAKLNQARNWYVLPMWYFKKKSHAYFNLGRQDEGDISKRKGIGRFCFLESFVQEKKYMKDTRRGKRNLSTWGYILWAQANREEAKRDIFWIFLSGSLFKKGLDILAYKRGATFKKEKRMVKRGGRGIEIHHTLREKKGKKRKKSIRGCRSCPWVLDFHTANCSAWASFPRTINDPAPNPSDTKEIHCCVQAEDLSKLKVEGGETERFAES